MPVLEQSLGLREVHDALVHERHGVITRLIEQNESPEAPGLHVFNALTLKPAFFRANVPSPSPETAAGSGAHFDRSRALWSVFGEVVERYCGSIYFPEELAVASVDELGPEAVAPDEFILFAPEQYAGPGFPFFPPRPGRRVQWCRARELGEGSERWVPAQMVYLGMGLLGREEEMAQSTSTGLACGPSFEAAVLSGLCEVLERDAFSTMWQLRARPRSLAVDEAMAGRLAPRVLGWLREGPLRLRLWSLLTDLGVPAVLAAADSPHEGVFTVGASCHPDPARAIEKAVIEALHGFVWGRSKLQSGEPVPRAEQVRSPQDHLSFYLDPAHRDQAAFLFSPGPELPASRLPCLPVSLDGLIAGLADRGFRALAADVTTRDMAGLGLNVARVVVPGLQPLLFGAHLRTRDLRRLRRAAAHWGVPCDPEANPSPHPFP